jgi:glycosyltransferase involved in cell wall biosynthesis
LKVAWLMPNLHVTGGARVAAELSDRMARKGHEIYILIPAGRNKSTRRTSATVIECGLPVCSPLLAVATGMLAMLIKVPPVDILVSSMPPYVLLARFIARRRGIPSVNYLMNDDVHFFDDRSHIKSGLLLALYRYIARRSIRKMTIFVNSHWTAVRCVSEGGAKPAAFVPHGYDPEVLNADPILRNSDRIPVIVTVGRKEAWKGFGDLVRALNLVDQQQHPFKLLVISQNDFDLSPANFPVTLVKPRNDSELAEYYRSGDIYIHPSWFEGFGMPPLEAQACGLAVISTDSGGVREFLKNGENAVIVPPREPRTLAKAVERVLSDKNLRANLRNRGLETCIEFTWDKAVVKFETALQNLIDRSRP